MLHSSSFIYILAPFLRISTIYRGLKLCRLAQWDKRRSAEREAVGSNPGLTNTQGL